MKTRFNNPLSCRGAVILVAGMAGLLATPAVAASQEQGVQVFSEVDKRDVFIGDLIEYRVTVERGAGIQLTWPSLGSNLGAFEIREYQVVEPEEVEGSVREAVRYTISTFDTGTYVIPPLTLAYTLEGDTAYYELKSEPLEVFVKSLSPDTAGDIRGLKEQAVIERDWQRIALFAGLGVALLGLAAWLLWYFKFRRQDRPLFDRQPPPRPAHELALEALARLESRDLVEKGEVKQYFIALSDILRAYLGQRFRISAMEATTYEILAALKAKPIGEPERERINHVLEICDLGKFAKYGSTPEECAEVFAATRALVLATKPAEVAKPETGNGATPVAEARPASRKTEDAS